MLVLLVEPRCKRTYQLRLSGKCALTGLTRPSAASNCAPPQRPGVSRQPQTVVPHTRVSGPRAEHAQPPDLCRGWGQLARVGVALCGDVRTSDAWTSSAHTPPARSTTTSDAAVVRRRWR
eukprot:510913-Prymnesium_polylepis.1